QRAALLQRAARCIFTTLLRVARPSVGQPAYSGFQTSVADPFWGSSSFRGELTRLDRGPRRAIVRGGRIVAADCRLIARRVGELRLLLLRLGLLTLGLPRGLGRLRLLVDRLGRRRSGLLGLSFRLDRRRLR